MARKANVLTKELVASFCATVPTDKYGRPVKRKYYGDGFITGLFLEVFVNPEGKVFSHWCYRIPKHNKRVALGSYPMIGLDEARKRAIYCSLNPEDAIKGIVSKEEGAKVEPMKRSYAMSSLRSVTELWFEHAKEIHYYKEERYRQREYHRFAKNILSAIGSIPVDVLTLDDVSRAFRPLWSKPATNKRLLGVLRNVIRFAVRKKLASVEKIYICDKKQLNDELGKVFDKEQSQPALPPERVPAFMKVLRAHQGKKYRLLEFQILCALRAGNARKLLWSQVHNLDTPEECYVLYKPEDMKVMKNGAFRVPLSPRAVDILREMSDYREKNLAEEHQYVFPAEYKIGSPYSDAVPSKVIEELHQEALARGEEGWIDPIATENSDDGEPVRVTAHGVARASFETWAVRNADYREKALELCLHHREKSSIKEAYNRFDYFDERRAILRDWCTFCGYEGKE